MTKLEMCYDGALVMPSNYAVVNEEEMTYIDGGFFDWNTIEKICTIFGGISSLISVVGFTVKALKFVSKSKFAFAVATKISAVATKIGAFIGAHIGAIIAFVGSIAVGVYIGTKIHERYAR